MNKILKNLLKYVVGFVVLGFVLWANWNDKPNPAGGPPHPGIGTLLARSPDWPLLAAAGGLLVVVIGLQIFRWFLLVRAVELPFTLANAYRLGLVGYFYNTLLPGSIGGDLIKAYFISQDHPERRPTAMATVLVDRLLGLFGLLLLASTIGGSLWAADNEQILASDYLQKIVIVTGGLIAAAIVGWVVMGLLPAKRADRFGERLAKLPLGKTLAEVWAAVLLYRRRPRVIYLSVLISAAAHVSMVLLFHCTVRIYGAVEPASLAEHFVIGPIGYIAQVFFPAPGGVGGGEYIFGYLYTIIGHPEQTGVLGRLTLRVLEIGGGVIGYVVYLTMKKELADAVTEEETVMAG